MFEAMPVVRLMRWREWTLETVVPSQDVSDSVGVRYMEVRVPRGKYAVELTTTPCRVTLSLLEH